MIGDDENDFYSPNVPSQLKQTSTIITVPESALTFREHIATLSSDTKNLQ